MCGGSWRSSAQKKNLYGPILSTVGIFCLSRFLLDHTALASRHEVGEVADVLAAAALLQHVADDFQCLRGIALAAGQGAHGRTQFAELLGGEAASLQAYLVEAVGVVVALDGGERVGQHVLGDRRSAADVAVLADAAELVHRTQRADYSEVLDDDVSGQRCGVGEDAAIADRRVVSDVGVGHDEAVRADRRQAASADGSAGDGDVFADGDVVADLQARRLTCVLQVLRRDAEAGEGEDAVATSERRVAVENDMRDKLAVFAEHDVCADGAEGTDPAARRNDRACGHNRGRMNAHGFTASEITAFISSTVGGRTSAFTFRTRGTSWQVMVASATILPSTVHSPRILTARERQLTTVTSIRSWSPGRTGRRKRASSMPVKTISLPARSSSENSVSSSAPPACAIASMVSTPGMIG